MGRLANLIKSLMGICETVPLRHDLWSVEGTQVRVRLSQVPELCMKGEGVYLKGQGLHKSILIVRTEDDQHLAFTNRCTHLMHRKLDPIRGQTVLRCCSMRHSLFDYEGIRLTGPAEHSLKRHEVEMSEGDLLIEI